MPLAALLNADDPLFDFEHMMAHRNYFAVMWPLNRFSVLPYQLDPSFMTDVRASPWNLNHQKAHNDYAGALPAYFDASQVGFGIALPSILVDSSLAESESKTWWTFANHQEHYIANGAILPLPSAAPSPPPWYPGTQFPFW